MAVENTIIQNLNDVIETKNEIRNILRDNGMNPGSVFKEYPAMLRSVIGSGGSGGGTIDQETINSYISAYFSSYYITGDRVLTANDEGYDLKNLLLNSGAITWHDDYGESGAYDYTILLTENHAWDWYLSKEDAATTYATKSYVVNYVATYGGTTPDLSSYVTKTELSNQSYVTATDLDSNVFSPEQVKVSNNPNSTLDLFTMFINSGVFNDSAGQLDPQYLTINNLATQTYVLNKIGQVPAVDLSSYVTKTELSNQSYATTSDVPTIDENIIPKESNTYTLGDSTYFYSNVYSSSLNVGNNSRVYNDAGGITLSINNNAGVRFGSSNLYPKTSGSFSLGTSTTKWNNTYTSNIYADNTYSGKYNFAYNTWIGSDSNYEFHIGVNAQKRFQYNMYQFYAVTNPDNSSLGVPNFPWAYTYTKFLIGKNAYISTAAYLPVNTYWYDGSTYHWLGSLFS